MLLQLTCVEEKKTCSVSPVLMCMFHASHVPSDKLGGKEVVVLHHLC